MPAVQYVGGDRLCRGFPGGSPLPFRRRRRRPLFRSHDEDAPPEPERHLHGIRDPGARLFPDGDPVDDDLDRVHLIPVDGHPLCNLPDVPVDPYAQESVLQDLPEQLAIVPLPGADNGGQELNLRSLGQTEYAVDDLVRRLLLHLPAALCAVLRPGTGEEKPEIVVDFRDGPHRRAGVGADGFLLDGDRRTQPLDVVDVRPLHDVEELARVRREALDEPALSFRIYRVKGEAGLPGPGKTGHHHKLPPGNIDVDILQVMLARATNDYRIPVGHASCCQEKG